MTDFSGKVALITGSSRGLGRAIAVRYASLGACVVINHASDEGEAQATVGAVQAAGSEAIAIQADVSNVDDLERLFVDSINHFGKLDIVVANAGVELINQPLLEATEEQFDRLFNLNTKGAFFTLQKAAQHIADGGRIINIGSSTTCMALPGVGLYGSSKMALRYVVEVLAQEVGRRDVTVNTILPTAIEYAGVFTDIRDDDPMRKLAARDRPIGARMGTPDDVADAAEYFASDLAAWVSGQHLLISGGGTT